MSEQDNGGSAFPHDDGRFNGNGDWLDHENTGMTLRDYFAAKAMQGFLAGEDCGDLFPTYDSLAVAAHKVADAMLAAREAS